MSIVKVYYRVYNGVGVELFASKSLQDCKDNLEILKSEGLPPYSIRKIVYMVYDTCAFVVSNKLIFIE